MAHSFYVTPPMPKKLLYLTLALVVVGSIVFAAVKNTRLFQGWFVPSSSTVSTMSCDDMPTNILYVNSNSSTVRGDGSQSKPYMRFSQLESRLESDSSIEGVCVGGSLSRGMNFDDVLSPSLVFKSATSESAVLGSSGGPAVLTYNGSGILSNLELHGFTFEAPVDFNGLELVAVSNVFNNTSDASLTLDNGTVEIEKNIFQGGDSIAISLYDVSGRIDNNFILSYDAGIRTIGDTDLEVYFNSFYDNNYGLYLSETDTIELKNNIFYANSGQYALTYTKAGYSTGVVEQVDLESDYNLFYGLAAYVEFEDHMPSGGIWYYEYEWDLSDFQVEGYDASSLEGDPLFMDVTTGDLHIRMSSPAVNEADLLVSVTEDIDGDSRSSSIILDEGEAEPDIGADERQLQLDL